MALILKWGFILAFIIALVSVLSSKQRRTPIFNALRKFKWQIIIVSALFMLVLQTSLFGT